MQQTINAGPETIPIITFIKMSSKGNNILINPSEIGIRMFSIVKVTVLTNMLKINNNKGIVIATKMLEHTIPTIE